MLHDYHLYYFNKEIKILTKKQQLTFNKAQEIHR